MKKVKVNFRNRDKPCNRCGYKVKHKGTECYVTIGRASRRGVYYCIECGDIVQDSTKRDVEKIYVESSRLSDSPITTGERQFVESSEGKKLMEDLAKKQSDVFVSARLLRKPDQQVFEKVWEKSRELTREELLKIQTDQIKEEFIPTPKTRRRTVKQHKKMRDEDD